MIECQIGKLLPANGVAMIKPGPGIVCDQACTPPHQGKQQYFTHPMYTKRFPEYIDDSVAV